MTLRAGDALVLPRNWARVAATGERGGYSAAANCISTMRSRRSPVAKRRKWQLSEAAAQNTRLARALARTAAVSGARRLRLQAAP